MRLLPVLFLLLAAPLRAETFVLVPGAFTGAWYWEEAVAALEAAGHRAVAVELTGQGARIAEGGPEVDIATHAADIVAAIEAAGEERVILVAYSYGARPATLAWEQAGDRIAHLVWIEAVAPVADGPVAIPADGRSLAFLVTTQPDTADSGMLAPSPTLREEPGRPLAPMSLRCLYGEVRLAAPPLPAIPGTYIHAEDSALPVLRRYGERLRDWRGWDLVAIPGGHDVMRDAPEAVVAALLAVAD